MKWFFNLFKPKTKTKVEVEVKKVEGPSTSTNKELKKPAWVSELEALLGKNEVKDNSFLKKWLKSDGKTLGDPAKLPWCFRGDVQILTEMGWQDMSNITADKVYQVDDNNEMSLTTFDKIEKEYSGKIDVLNHNSFILHADPNHMWYGSFGTETRKKIEKPDSFGLLSSMTTQGLRIPNVHARSKESAYTKDVLGFVAAVISDGNMYHRDGKFVELRFEVSKDRKIKRLDSFNPKSKHTQKKVYGPLTKTPLTVYAFDVPVWFDDIIDEEKKLRQSFVNSMTQEDCKNFLNEYRNFDGMTTRFHLYTSCEKTLGQLSQIIVMAGYRYGVSTKTSPLSNKICYEIHVRTDSTKTFINKKLLTKEEFSGKLYCVRVPHSRIIIREKNRGAVLTGNCGDAVETALKLHLKDEDWPDELRKNPYWARNWVLFGHTAPHIPYGAVVSFERPGGGGHVGFAVGTSADKKQIYVLGGNQSNSVTIAPIAMTRLLASRWPKSVKMSKVSLPVLSGGTISKNEA